MNVPKHWHVTINGETATSAHVTLDHAQADQIEAETRDRTIASDVVQIVECSIRCQEILDVLVSLDTLRQSVEDLDGAYRRMLDDMHLEAVVTEQAEGPA